MKQLLFLLLFPCLAMAQYPGNGNQKITLGEQTSADGLVYRGLAADTTRKPSVDTMAFILLDTNTNIIWQYKKAVNNAWTRVGGSISSGVTGVLPVANGGTGQSTLAAAGINTGSGTANYLPKYTAATTFGNSLIYDNGSSVGIGTSLPSLKLDVVSASQWDGIRVYNTTASQGADIRVGNDDNNNLGFLRVGGSTSGGNNQNTLMVGTGGGYNIHIAPNGSPAITALNGGNVGIGTTSPLALLNVMGTVRINSASAPDANYYLQLENSSSQKAKANAWDTYSDKRIKTDIQPIVNAIDKVNLLNPVYYQKHDSYVENDFLNIDFDSSVKSLGFIAQEVYNVIPEAVNTGTTNELWAMDYTKIIPILTKAIQEQQALIKALEQRILNLENK